MRVTFEFDPRGWQITPRAVELVQAMDDKVRPVFLHECLVQLQSRITNMVKEKKIKDPQKAHLIVEDGVQFDDSVFAIACAAMVVDMYMNKTMTVRLELHMMMTDEYQESEVAKEYADS